MPDWADPGDLDPAVRQALRGLESRNAERVAGHLVAAGTLLDDDPGEALAHARAARDRASRLAVVREAVGVAAYHAGDYAEAGRELRAYRRMTGEQGYRAVLADCERALGRPDVALRLVREALQESPGRTETVELRLVEAGARRDLGELSAARLVLETALGGRPTPAGADLGDPGALRLATAYADLLLATGQQEPAEQWLAAVARHTPDDDDVEFVDAIEDDADEPTAPAPDPAAPPVPDDPGVPEAHPLDDDVEAEIEAEVEAEVAELLGEVGPPDQASPRG